MAPAATDAAYESPTVFTYDNPSKSIFPDGIKTSGQTDPDYDLIKPYDDFPTEITGPTVWKAEDYSKNPEQWTHHFTEEEIKEMSEAADAFIASETPLTGICKVRLLQQAYLGSLSNVRVGEVSTSKHAELSWSHSQRDP